MNVRIDQTREDGRLPEVVDLEISWNSARRNWAADYSIAHQNRSRTNSVWGDDALR
jgi:hypothetical protein